LIESHDLIGFIKGIIPPLEGEVTGPNKDGKVLKPDLVAWTRINRLVKVWITVTFDAFKIKLGL
jgi:hypothetical protein